MTFAAKASTSKLAIVGGGPAGLMAAQVASRAGVAVDIYEAKGSVGRKFLLAGKGGLNLTHSEEFDDFLSRYGDRREHIERWLQSFTPDDIRAWAKEMGVDTFVGSSGRVFPLDMKAAPLLRAWVRRLREQGVRFHVNHYCERLSAPRQLSFKTSQGRVDVDADAIVLALGGASWPQLGSDGAWVGWLRSNQIDIAELQPSNCGFDVAWSEVFAKKFAGEPVKSIAIAVDAQSVKRQGEFVISQYGVEGSLIYALSAEIREMIRSQGSAQVHLDLMPDMTEARVRSQLSQPRGGRTLTEHLRRTVNIDGVKAGLLYEVLSRLEMNDPDRLAAAMKSLPLTLLRPRPLAEAISTSGGVKFESLNADLMLNSLPGVFCAGEMLDWEAPTGGYLLTACMASGRAAGRAAVEWLSK